MAKQREVKQWITVNGKHVPIFEGESKADAVKRAVGKNNSTDTEKKSAGQKEEKPDWIADWDPIPDDPKEERKKRLAREKADEDDAYDKEHGEGKYAKKETVEDKKKAQKDKFFNDPYMQKAMKKAGVTREDWESGKVSDSQKYNISNDAYKMGDRAEKRAAKKAQSKKPEDGSNSKKEPVKKMDLSKEGTYNLKGEKAPKDLPRVSDEDAKHNKEVQYNGTTYHTQQVVDYDRDKKQDYVAGHLYVPHNDFSKGSFFVSQDGKMYHSGSDYLREKSQSKMREEYEKSKTQKQISKDLDTKEKQIAQHQAEANRLNGRSKRFKKADYEKSEKYVDTITSKKKI